MGTDVEKNWNGQHLTVLPLEVPSIKINENYNSN